MRHLGWFVPLAVLAAWWYLAPSAPQYPSDWPRPAWGYASLKDGCPDLAGSFAQVGSEMPWLLGTDPDIMKSQPHWPDYRAIVSQAPDASSMDIVFVMSPTGLAEYRNRLLRFNQASNGRADPPPLHLARGRDYDCARGWLVGSHFAQDAPSHGSQRTSLKLRRDSDGGLIAGAAYEEASSIGWGDALLSLGFHTKLRWHRWPRDRDDTPALLAAMQSVDLHRYGWENGAGYSTPIRFTSFYVEPLCARLVETWTNGHESVVERNGPEQGKADWQCPKGWGKFDMGEVLRADIPNPGKSTDRYRLEWYARSEGAASPHTMVIDDVKLLAEMPR